MSIPRVDFVRGIKGKREDGAIDKVTFSAVGKVEKESRVKRGTKTEALPDGEIVDTLILVEDGVVTDLNEALSLMPNEQETCNALVRHANHLAYRSAVEKVVGVEAPDELDDLIGDVLSGDEKTTFKRTVSLNAKMFGTSRLEEGQSMLQRMLARKAS